MYGKKKMLIGACVMLIVYAGIMVLQVGDYAHNTGQPASTFKTQGACQFNNEWPTNGSTDLNTSLNWSVSISAQSGDPFSWAIECSNGLQENGSYRDGFLQLVDGYGLDIESVWGDGTYLYTAESSNGIRVFSFNGTALQLLDAHADHYYFDIWGDGTYIYTAGGTDGLRAFTFDGSSLTFVNATTGYYYADVWGDGTYIYTACDSDGMHAYTFNGTAFTLIDDHVAGSDYYVGVWGDGTYIYAACHDDGIRAYTFDGVSFSLLDTHDGGGLYLEVWGTNDYIYAACYGSGVRAYAFNGTQFTLLATKDDGGNYWGVWSNELYVCAACHSSGLRVYDFNGTSFNELDSVLPGSVDYWDVWGDGTNTYVATSGIGLGVYEWRYTLPLTDLGFNATYTAWVNTTTDVTTRGWFTFTTKASPFADGNGSAADPYQIANWTHLNNTRHYLDKNFTVVENLSNATADYAAYNTGAGWLPIGTITNRFTGSFNGQNKTISDLVIFRNETQHIGLFGVSEGVIDDVGVLNCTVTGGAEVGSLMGNNRGEVIRCYATGNVSGKSTVGGLIGVNVETVVCSYATTTVVGNTTGAYGNYIGGLIGWNGGDVNDSYATGNVSGKGSVGGFVGYVEQGTMQRCYATGNVNASSQKIGGFVGDTLGGLMGTTFNECYTLGDVAGYANVGGFIGFLQYNGPPTTKIANCYVRGNSTRQTGSTSGSIGGFCGENQEGNITFSYSTGSVYYDGASDPTDKGFVGLETDWGAGDLNDQGNFFDVTVSNQVTTDGNATPISTKDLKNVETGTTAGWEIQTTTTYLNDGYPYLGWQQGNASTWMLYAITPTSCSPYHQETNVALTIPYMSFTISDPEGQTFNYTVETVPDIGSNAENDVYSGMKYCSVIGLVPATTYTWFVNITNAYGTFYHVYNFTTTHAPYVSQTVPADGDNATAQPVCTAWVHDLDGGTLTVRFFENSTGTWVLRKTVGNVEVVSEGDAEEVVWGAFTQADTYDHMYWWRVQVQDDKGATNTTTVALTPRNNPPVIYALEPVNNSTNNDLNLLFIRAYIEDMDNHSLAWSIETAPHIGSSSGTMDAAEYIYCPLSGMVANTTYAWYVNVSDGYTWTNKTYTFTTARKPEIRAHYPLNGSTVPMQPYCSVQVSNVVSENITITFSENTSGVFVEGSIVMLFADPPQSAAWLYLQANATNATYWWHVHVENEQGAITEETYCFHTSDAPTALYVDPQPYGTDVNLSLAHIQATVSDPNNDTIQWTIETSPNLGNASAIGTPSNSTITCPVSGLLANTTYTWYINMTDGTTWSNQTYYFTTSAPPTVIEAYPQGENASRTRPQAYVDVYDPDKGYMDVTFYSNASGSWKTEWQETSIWVDGVTRVYWNFTNATEYETTYWWQVNLSDRKGNAVTANYNFTTMENEAPALLAYVPLNGSQVDTASNLIQFNLYDADNDSMNVTVEIRPGTASQTVNGTYRGWQIIDTSSLQPNEAYTWYVNATDGNKWLRQWYIFSTNANNESNMSAPSPANHSVNVPLSTNNLSIYLYDIDDDLIRWTIETSPDVGSVYNTYQIGGTKTLTIDPLDPGTRYQWYVNITDGGNWVLRWFTFNTSYLPNITAYSPINNSTGTVDVQPYCQVTINDQDNDPENITVRWYTNASGGWVLQQTNDNIAALPATLSYQYTGATTHQQTYWWRVNVSDGKGGYMERTYRFTTKENEAPSITPTPANGSTDQGRYLSQISAQIQDVEGHTFNWTIETVPDVGSASGHGASNGVKSCSISGLTMGQTYVWFVNVTDRYGATNTTWFTFTITFQPVITNMSPMHATVGIRQPICSIDVYDADGDDLTVSFYSHNGVTYVLEYVTAVNGATTTTVVWDRYLNATERGELYLWYVHVEDTKNGVAEKWLIFQMNYLPNITANDPVDQAYNVDAQMGMLNATIGDRDDHVMNWTIETWPDVGSASGNNASNTTIHCPISSLAANTTYSWWVNVSDGMETTQEQFTFQTGKQATIGNETPAHQATGITRMPRCAVTVNDPDNDTVTVHFYEWMSGSWILKQTNSSINATNNVTVVWSSYGNASDYNTTYVWRVVVIDSKGIAANESFQFTTIPNQAPLVTMVTPTDGESNVAKSLASIQATIADPEGHDMNWSLVTSPDIGNASGTYETNGTIVCPLAGILDEQAYTWTLTIDDGRGAIAYTYAFTIALKPCIVNEQPTDNQRYVPLLPRCNATVYDPGNNTMNIRLYRLENASWVLEAEQISMNGSQWHNIIYAAYATATTYNTTYQWKVAAENDKGCTVEEIYAFTTVEDTIPPTIHNVTVYPSEVQVGTPVTFTAKVTDVGGSVHAVSLCISSSGTNITMLPVGNDTYSYVGNFSEAGNYVFYIQAEDVAGNRKTSNFYSFTILIKVLAIRMYALERIHETSDNLLLIQLTHAKLGTQISGLENNITISIIDPAGVMILTGQNPTEKINGLYTLPFNATNTSGTYRAWATITYNASTYIDAVSFELRSMEYYNVSGLTERMEDVFAATLFTSYNTTAEIISHLRQMGVEIGDLEQETELAGLSGSIFDEVIKDIFKWIFMTIFLLVVFVVGTFAYGRQKGTKLAREASNVPRAVIARLAG